MFYLFRKFGDLLDALDVGGWLCLGLGASIVAVTVLAPAWKENQRLRYEQSILHRQTVLMELKSENYGNFIQAVENNDPLLLQRLAWSQLQLMPAGSEPIEWIARNPLIRDVRVDPWLEPSVAQLPPVEQAFQLPDTRLVRWVTGPSRPWVMAFGGWLILLGLLVNPRRPQEPPPTQHEAAVPSALQP